MEELTVWFAKMNKDAIIPSKRDEDSDYDLYACFDEDSMELPPHQTTLVPTGLMSAMGKETGVKFEERGSNTKWCGVVQAGVIDSGYRGEWIVPIYNGNDIPVVISKGVKEIQRKAVIVIPYSKAICQFNIRRIDKSVVEEHSIEEILAVKSERGVGKLGSSGK